MSHVHIASSQLVTMFREDGSMSFYAALADAFLTRMPACFEKGQVILLGLGPAEFTLKGPAELLQKVGSTVAQALGMWVIGLGA